jgi:hypothetical protein
MFLLWHGRQKMQFQVGKGVRENEAALSNPYISGCHGIRAFLV